VTSLRGWRGAAGAWALIIVVSGTLPTREAVHAVSQGQDTAITTLGHFAAYALLAFLLAAAMGGWEAGAGVLWRALIAATALGVAVEVIQAPLPYRDAQVLDGVVNAAGAAAGLLVFSVVGPAWRRRSRRG
jgi:VanZ family protein